MCNRKVDIEVQNERAKSRYAIVNLGRTFYNIGKLSLRSKQCVCVKAEGKILCNICSHVPSTVSAGLSVATFKLTLLVGEQRARCKHKRRFPLPSQP